MTPVAVGVTNNFSEAQRVIPAFVTDGVPREAMSIVAKRAAGVKTARPAACGSCSSMLRCGLQGGKAKVKSTRGYAFGGLMPYARQFRGKLAGDGESPRRRV
jgi:hypothetical protein